jgi:hypothetical protein
MSGSASPASACSSTARHRADFQLRQPLGGKPDHLAQQIGIGASSGN